MCSKQLVIVAQLPTARAVARFQMPCAGFVRNMRERGATEIHFLPPRFFAATAEESEGGSDSSADNG